MEWPSKVFSPYRTEWSSHISVTPITAGLDSDAYNLSSDIFGSMDLMLT